MNGARILLVDDDPPSLTLMRTLLELQGCTVTPAENEDDALQLFAAAAERFDLLVTDILLPGQQRGYHLAWQLTERDPALRVLLVSAHASAHDQLDGAVPVRTAFLEKPFQPAAFVEAVRDLLA